MKKLEEMRLDTVFLYLPGNSQLLEDKPADMDLSVRYQELPLKLENKYSQNLFYKVALLVKLIWNYRLIKHYIKERKPSAVVVGSDLGNVHIRFLMEACLQYRIPVFVIYNCDVPIPGAHSETSVLQSSSLTAIPFLPGIRFIRAVFFKNDIPGKYHHNATLCVLSEDIRSKLIRYGIQSERIVSTGMPATENHPMGKEEFLAKLNIPAHGRVIAFVSGPTGEIAGMAIECAVLKCVCRMVEDLPDDVFLIIKVHPREAPHHEEMLQQMFSSKRCRIIKSIPAEDMIPHIDLLLGNFSRVLITAAVKGKRFLCINCWDDPRSLLNRMEANILEINAIENLTARVRIALDDPVYQLSMDEACRSVADRYTVDGEADPAFTIASLIYRSVHGTAL